MSNNYIPNTSAIPNVLFDYWMGILTPAEFKVLMCIARKTYGWHKVSDLISLKQIEKITGLHRSGIIKNVDSLVGRGLLNKIKSKTTDGDDAPNMYEINVYCVEGGSLLNRPGVVYSVDQGVVYSVDPQKKDSTKYNIQKDTSLKVPEEPKAAIASQVDLNPCSKPKKEKPDFAPHVREVANKLLQIVVDDSPSYIVPKNLTPLIQEVHNMLNIDKRDPEILYAVLRTSLPDPFYGPGLLNGNLAKKLRDKFVTLEKKMNAAPAKNPNEVDRRLRDKKGNVVDEWKDRIF
jgi:phage replication O-like protein O